MVQVSDVEFEAAVADALDSIPARLLDAMDNVVIQVEDEPPSGDPGLLGVYEGVPLTERTHDGPLWPDRIVLFRGPLQRLSRDARELREQVAVTVVHEIAHHFGIDDDRLDELGWG